MSWHVGHVTLGSVTYHPENPKGHDEDEIRQSIIRHGFVEPVLVDERTGYLLSGHGRIKVLRRMKDNLEPPPDGVLSDDGVWQVPAIVGWASVDDDEARALLLSLNRTTETGGWIDHDLLAMLEQVEQSGLGLAGTGFDDRSLRDLRALLDGPPELDELLDSWAQEAEDDDVNVVIKLEGLVAESWQLWRRRYSTDEGAMQALLGDHDD